MKKLLRKEFCLCASPLSYWFMGFGLMFFLPGYPVLCGAFFVTLGIFQSFQNAREANDLLFSILLPIAKGDVVRGKYLFSCCIELGGFGVMVLSTLIRQTFLAEAPAYLQNALMNANLFALGMALILFGLFNAIFVGGFFRTACKLGRPFFGYTAAAFLIIGLAEAMHHVPGMAWVNSSSIDALHLCTFIGCVVCYTGMTLCSCRLACKRFALIDF